jgi:hypothetical protein
MKNKHNTKAAYILLTIVLGFAIILWPQSGLGQQISTPDPNAIDEKKESIVPEEQISTGQDTWAGFQIIMQRNIFSRQRGPIRQRRSIQSRPVITQNPESYLLLKGIVQEGGIFIAFIENTQNNMVLRLREGQNIARGTVKNFSLDSIEYQSQDKTINIILGQDLEGNQGTLSLNRLLELSATTSVADDPNTATEETIPSDEEAEILRKLMEQRKQQLGH